MVEEDEGGKEMSRIEEIGKKIARYKKWNEEDKVLDYYNSTHLPEFINDIQYLLSALDHPQNWWDLYDKFQDKIAEKLKLKDKLEQAEKDIEAAYDYISQTDQELTKQHLLKALKQLRED